MIRDSISGLDVPSRIAAIDNEVYLQLPIFLLPLDRHPLLNESDIHVEFSGPEFVVDDVLHQMRRFLLSEVQPDVPESDICSVVFVWGSEKLPPLDIVSGGLLEKVGIAEYIQIPIHGIGGQSRTVYRRQSVSDSGRIRQGSCGRAEQIEDKRHLMRHADIIVFLDVLQIHLPDQTVKVGHLLLVIMLVQQFGHPSEGHILVPKRPLIFFGICRTELGEGERANADLVAPAAEFCQDIGGQEFGVASRDVYIHIIDMTQSVDGVDETIDVLYLIEDNITRSVRGFQF